MIRFKNIYTTYLFRLLLVIQFFVLPLNISAQQLGTKITDNSKEASSPAASNLSILELDSSQKGFLLPRMTTSQRDNINVDIAKDQGLAIYNTTINCIEYFNSNLNSWVSLCGETLPAEITILPNQCQDIKVLGEYYQNHELDPSNGIVMKVTTSKSGAYHIIAKSTNGYSFEANGKFPSTGTYTVFLKGDGKPMNGYAVDSNGLPSVKGDKLSITINNKVVSCEPYVFVNKDMPIYSITSTKVNGHYFTAEGVTAQETITVQVNVDRPGKWIMKTDNVEGVEFYGEGNFLTKGVNTVTLKARGQAKKAGDHTVTITANSLNTLGGPIVTAETVYRAESFSFNVVNCEKVTYSNSVYVNELIPSGTTMKVYIKVLAPGKNLTIRSGFTITNGPTVWFKSGAMDLPYDRSATGPNANVREITLTVQEANRDHATSTPSKRTMFFMDSDGFKQFECTNADNVYLDIKSRMKPIVTFKSPFASVEQPGTYYIPPYTDMSKGTNSTNTLLNVKFYAGGTGTVAVETNNVNGIQFSGTLNITNGIAEGNLYASGIAGTPLSLEDAEFIIKRKDNNATITTTNLDFVYRRMKVVSYGGQIIFSNVSSKNAGSASTLVQNKNLLGWNGVVRVDGFEYLDPDSSLSGVFTSSSTTDANAVKFKEQLSNADIVTLTGLLAKKSEAKLNLLYDYVMDKDFALIFTERYDGTILTSKVNFYIDFNTFVKRFDLGFAGVTAQGNTDVYKGLAINKLSGDHFSKLYGNEFMDSYPSGAILNYTDTYLGFSDSGGDGSHSFYFKSVPKGFSALYVKPGTTTPYGIVHNSKAIILLGNHRPFFGFNAIPTKRSLYGPLQVTEDASKAPMISINYGLENSNTDIDVYNAHHLLNTLHWCIDYAQKNK